MNRDSLIGEVIETLREVIKLLKSLIVRLTKYR